MTQDTHTCCDQCWKELEKIQRSELNIIFTPPGYREAPKVIYRRKNSDKKVSKGSALQWIAPAYDIMYKADAILLKVFQLLCQKLSVTYAKVCRVIRNRSRRCTHDSSNRVPEATCVSCVTEKLTRMWCRRLSRGEEERRAYFQTLTETLSSLVEPFRLIGYIGNDRILYNTVHGISQGIGCSNVVARRRLKNELHAYRTLHTAPKLLTETQAVSLPSCTSLSYMIDEDDGCDFM